LNRRKFAVASAALLNVIAFSACSEQAPSANAPAARGAKPSDKEAYELAMTGTGFTVGPIMAVNTVYVFFDTTCPHCAELWAASQPLVGKLKMVWMPIGLLRPSSGPQGATILAASNPAAAMTENETSVQQRKGGITVSPTLPEATLDKVKANTELFRRLGADSVPYILFKNPKTGAYGSFAGATDTARLAQMVGV
jgi:thiol:disulfide interchange protein DsbG